MAKKKEKKTEARPEAPVALPELRPGDIASVHVRIVEGDKERVQAFEGTVISIRGRGRDRTFTVRKMSRGIGIERIFPFASPAIARIEVKRHSRVRRAKLYYLRGKKGRSAQLREKRTAAPRAGEKAQEKPD